MLLSRLLRVVNTTGWLEGVKFLLSETECDCL
jgi:hypothetical protein